MCDHVIRPFYHCFDTERIGKPIGAFPAFPKRLSVYSLEVADNPHNLVGQEELLYLRIRRELFKYGREHGRCLSHYIILANISPPLAVVDVDDVVVPRPHRTVRTRRCFVVMRCFSNSVTGGVGVAHPIQKNNLGLAAVSACRIPSLGRGAR